MQFGRLKKVRRREVGETSKNAIKHEKFYMTIKYKNHGKEGHNIRICYLTGKMRHHCLFLG